MWPSANDLYERLIPLEYLNRGPYPQIDGPNTCAPYISTDKRYPADRHICHGNRNISNPKRSSVKLSHCLIIAHCSHSTISTISLHSFTSKGSNPTSPATPISSSFKLGPAVMAVTPDEARDGGPKSTQTSTVNLLIGIDHVERCVDETQCYDGGPSR